MMSGGRTRRSAMKTRATRKAQLPSFIVIGVAAILLTIIGHDFFFPAKGIRSAGHSKVLPGRRWGGRMASDAAENEDLFGSGVVSKIRNKDDVTLDGSFSDGSNSNQNNKDEFVQLEDKPQEEDEPEVQKGTETDEDGVKTVVKAEEDETTEDRKATEDGEGDSKDDSGKEKEEGDQQKDDAEDGLSVKEEATAGTDSGAGESAADDSDHSEESLPEKDAGKASEESVSTSDEADNDSDGHILSEKEVSKDEVEEGGKADSGNDAGEDSGNDDRSEKVGGQDGEVEDQNVKEQQQYEQEKDEKLQVNDGSETAGKGATAEEEVKEEEDGTEREGDGAGEGSESKVTVTAEEATREVSAATKARKQSYQDRLESIQREEQEAIAEQEQPKVSEKVPKEKDEALDAKVKSVVATSLEAGQLAQEIYMRKLGLGGSGKEVKEGEGSDPDPLESLEDDSKTGGRNSDEESDEAEAAAKGTETEKQEESKVESGLTKVDAEDSEAQNLDPEVKASELESKEALGRESESEGGSKEAETGDRETEAAIKNAESGNKETEAGDSESGSEVKVTESGIKESQAAASEKVAEHQEGKSEAEESGDSASKASLILKAAMMDDDLLGDPKETEDQKPKLDDVAATDSSTAKTLIASATSDAVNTGSTKSTKKPKSPKTKKSKKPAACLPDFLKVVKGMSGPEFPAKFAAFNISYIKRDRANKTDASWQPRFGGHQTLRQRSFSFKVRKNSDAVHCGFVKPPSSWANASEWFQVSKEDQEVMDSCQLVVASAIFGDYDHLRTPHKTAMSSWTKKTVCFIMFMDQKSYDGLSSDGYIPDGDNKVGLWKLIVVKNLPYEDDRKTGKVPKLILHRLFRNARYSIWVDSKLRLQADPIMVWERYLWREGNEYAISQHYDRSCVWDEVARNKLLNKYNHTLIDQQFEAYKADGLKQFDASDPNKLLPSNVPEGSYIIRAHSPMSNLFSCLWFNEVDRFTSRDQISFYYTFQKLVGSNTAPFHLYMFPDCERRGMLKLFKHKAEEGIVPKDTRTAEQIEQDRLRSEEELTRIANDATRYGSDE